MYKVSLSELVDIRLLQKMQNAICDYTGFNVMMYGSEGESITREDECPEFCKYVHGTEVGCEKCRDCHKMAALQSLITETPAVAKCHADNFEMVVPIMVDGSVVGSIAVGPVIMDNITAEEQSENALELGLDLEKYIELHKQVPHVSQNYFDDIKVFLDNMSDIISNLALFSYNIEENNKILKNTTDTQTAFIVDMNEELKRELKNLNDRTDRALDSGDTDIITEQLREYGKRAAGIIASFDDTVEYIKLSGGQLELNEYEYNIEQMFDIICGTAKKSMDNGEISFTYEVDNDIPVIILGDAGRLSQIINKLIHTLVSRMQRGSIGIRISCSKREYAMDLVMQVDVTGHGFDENTLDKIAGHLKNGSLNMIQNASEDIVSISRIGYLVREMSGQISMRRLDGKRVEFTIVIPQLEL